MPRSLVLAFAAALCLSSCGGSPSNSAAHVQGNVLAVDGRTWLVGKNVVVFPQALQPDGSVTVGADVAVDGTWGPAGQLVASRMEVLQAAPTTVPPVVSPSPVSQRVSPQPAAQPNLPAAKGKPKGGREKD